MTAYRISDPEIEKAIEGRFNVHDSYFYLCTPTYIVTPIGPQNSMKPQFKALVEGIRPHGYLPWLSKDMDRFKLELKRIRERGPQSYRNSIFLFLATTATVFLDGYLRSNNPVLNQILMPDTPVYMNALMFTVAIIAIFGLHELGHKVAMILIGVDASMPYFIPAPPGMGGTLGAVITQKGPLTNRDALFDLGFSGPLVGFIVTIIVAIVGINLSFVVTLEEVNRWSVMFPGIRFQSLPFPMFLEWLSTFLKPVSEDMTILLHPVSFAAWVGSLVTFINLIPSWQLDGGHISRALLGKSNHKKMSIAGVFILILSGFFVMAVMVTLFMKYTGNRGNSPLDDISPLSNSRKLLVFFYLGMMITTLVVLAPL
ncbi:MAG: site-2 protease family protein [Candidatus Bathyarchaeota archaeon]|nr:site-2 protease family protein [Candidatus Bathyarchaeota archaeon]